MDFREFRDRGILYARYFLLIFLVVSELKRLAIFNQKKKKKYIFLYQFDEKEDIFDLQKKIILIL